MDRIYGSGAAASPPAFPATPSNGYPQSANPGLGVPSTKTNPWWFYMITEEIRGVIEAAGLTPDGEVVNQLQAAIAAITAQSPSVKGVFNNLQASATGTNATVTVSADEIAVESAGFAYKTLRTVALSINAAAAGANGLDTGSLAASTWYAVWVIYNPTTPAVAGLLSLSATTPTLPTGYTHKARVGWIRTDGTANKYPLAFKQYARRVQYVVAAGSNMTALPIMVSGVQGSVTTPTWVATAVGSFVPPTASAIKLLSSGVGDALLHNIAPNNAYGANGSATNPPWFAQNGAQNTYGGIYSMTHDMLLESSNIYSASSGATNKIQCAGWEDNL